MQTIVLYLCYIVLILLFSTAYISSLIYCFVIWCLHTNKRRPCSSTLSGHPSSSSTLCFISLCPGYLIPDKSVFHFEHVTLHDFEHPWADGKPESKLWISQRFIIQNCSLKRLDFPGTIQNMEKLNPKIAFVHQPRVEYSETSSPVVISAIQEMWPAVHVSQEAKAQWAGSDEWRWPGVDFVFVNIDMQCRDISRI